MAYRGLTLIAASLSLFMATAAVAQDEPEDRFSGVFQLDVTNAYYFRGILQEREGVILEPWMELYYSLYSAEEGFLRDVTVGAGTWLSFQSERTLAEEDPQWLYEADYYPLVSFGLAGGVTATFIYYFYTSPNGAFTTVQEADLKLAWDDSEVNPTFPLQPWINIAYETENSSLGPDRGTGVQLGIAPTLYESDAFSLKAPVEAGFSFDGYYESESGHNADYGYSSVGLAASIPLTFMPEGLGAWSLGLAAKYMFFGHTLEEVNKGRSTYPVGTLSLGVAF